MKHLSLTRLVPLAGVAFALLTAAGDLTIGPFPDADAGIPELTRFYANHHARLSAGGTLLALAAMSLALFGTAVWMRIRASDAHPLIAAAALVGTAMTATAGLESARSYSILADLGSHRTISPAALQAWHIGGSAGALDGGSVLLLLAVAGAGLAGHAFPRWLALPAGALAILQLTPVSFLASLVVLVWAAITGLALSIRPTDAAAGNERPRAMNRSVLART